MPIYTPIFKTKRSISAIYFCIMFHYGSNVDFSNVVEEKTTKITFYNMSNEK